MSLDFCQTSVEVLDLELTLFYPCHKEKKKKKKNNNNTYQISQLSQWVSVLISSKLFNLDESQSWHPPNFLVSMSLGLDILKILESW